MDQTYYDKWSGLYFYSNEEVLEKAQGGFTKKRFNEICSWHNHDEYEEIKESLEFNMKCMLDVWKERVAEMMAEEFLDALGVSNIALKEHLKTLLLKE